MVFLEYRPRVLIFVARDVGMYGKGEWRCMVLSRACEVGMYGKGECRCLVVEHVIEMAVMTGWVEQDIIMYWGY